MTGKLKSTAALVAIALVGASCASTHAASPTSTSTTSTSTTSGSTTSGSTTSGSTTSGSTTSGSTTSGSATPSSTTSGSTTSGSATSRLATEAAGATTEVTLQVRSGENEGPFSSSRKLNVPAGWSAELWARVPDARMEAWTPQGDLLVSVPSGGEVVELTPGSDGQAAPTQKTLLSGLTQPQGLAFARLDSHWVLYVGESNRIDRYNWTAGGVGQATVVAGDLPDQDPSGDDVHRQKDVAVAPNGAVYFNVGSSSNANPDDRTATPPRGVIMAVNPDGTNLHVVETGVRNGEGLAVAPDGTVWTAVNNRDNVTYPFTTSYGGVGNPLGKVIESYVDNHPSDEVVPVTQGRDLGWPYCNPDPDLSTPSGSEVNVPFVADAVTNSNGKALNCAALTPVQTGLAAHSAPLGLDFLEGSTLPAPWSGGAVVAVHGSWDRQPPQPPAVLWMAWDTVAKTLRPAVTLIGGFQNADGSRWGRPVDAVPGPDGALYVSDDGAGAIYRLVPPTK